MSGGIAFKNDQYWSAAGWVYRAVLQSICEELEKESEYGLFEELSDEHGSAVCFEHLDVAGWPDEKFVYFCNVVKQAYHRYLEKGPEGWSQPDAFADFILHYGTLVEIAMSESTDP